VAQALTRSGYQVTEARDGAEGLRIHRGDPADLIITDVVMPEKEGLETILELRKEFPALKILAISGGGRNQPGDYLPVARKLGANRTLAKPFARAELLAAIRELLEP
jgi:DNA-binding response OmpR family regulator